MSNYFELIDNASVGRSYNWTALNIDLNFDKTEINIQEIIEGKTQFGNSNNERLFIHEYLHYIQNFYCNWGALTFNELVLALNKIGASKITDNFKIRLPLKIEEKADSELWNTGVKHYEKFRELIGNDKEVKKFEKICEYPLVIIKEITDESLIFNNGRLSYKISGKTIREHMAEIGALLFLDYSDDQIHNKFISERYLCSSEGILDKSPEYWIMFEYFYKNNYKNIAEGLFLLCHSALTTASPVRSIIRFFKNLNEYGLGNDLLSNVNGFLAMPSEMRAFTFSYDITILNITKQLELCTKYFEHSFYKFNSHIFTRILFNIYNSYSGKRYFENPSILRRKNFWASIIRQLGTPIMRYKDKSPIITSNDNELIDALTYFLGVVKVLENLTDSRDSKCPFHSEYNICKSNYKNDENCLNEPLLVKNPNDDGTECLYQNAIELMGFDGRLIIE